MYEAHLKLLLNRVLPRRTYLRLRAASRRDWPPIGFVRFGSLRRLSPISSYWGEDRGLPIDRYYVEHFLRRYAGFEGRHRGDIRGHVLEIGDDLYTRQFAGWRGEASYLSPVEKVDILHVDESNPRATVVGDLVDARQIPSDTYDCIICTQTLQLIYDVRSAVRTLHRILKPEGVVLATFPGISKICRPEVDLWGDYWRLTSLSARGLFGETFRPENVRIEAYGNVLAAIAFLHGVAAEELERPELELRDPDYEVLIAVRAAKEAGR